MILTFRPIKMWPDAWQPGDADRPSSPFDSTYTATLDLLNRELDQLAASDVFLQVDDTTWTTRLLEGEFPNYRTLLRTESPQGLVIDRDQLLEALATVKTLGDHDSKVRVTYDGDGTAVLTSTQAEVGEVTAEVDAGGSWPGASFNTRFLTELVASHASDTVTLEADGSLKPIMAHDGPVTTLCMPVR